MLFTFLRKARNCSQEDHQLLKRKETFPLGFGPFPLPCPPFHQQKEGRLERREHRDVQAGMFCFIFTHALRSGN